MKEKKMYIEDKYIRDVFVADTFFSRFKGLMFKEQKEIEKLGGLLIKPCSQIHTFFMRTPIDVLYLDKEGIILKAEERVMPGKCCSKVKKSVGVVEFPIGTVETWNIEVNQKLEVK